jgi:hypothetical protein
MAICKCPRCGRLFRTLDDEEGEHPCPGCGYEPGMHRPLDQCDCVLCRGDVDVDLTDDDPTWPEEE